MEAAKKTEAVLAQKANVEQQDWITPTLLNAAAGTIQYRKNNFGKLELQNTITVSSSSSVMTLATDYRPSVDVYISVCATDGTAAYMKIDTDGNVTFSVVDKTYSLNGISVVL